MALTYIPAWDIALRLTAGAGLAGLAGLERETRQRPAGIRTHALVGLGSSLFMIGSAFAFRDVLAAEHIELDPSRIAAQIVAGVGFLGTGTIISRGASVRGLTTAASVWVAAAIGVAAGGGMYAMAGMGTALSLVILLILRQIKSKVADRTRVATLHITYDPQNISVSQLCDDVESRGIQVKNVSVERKTVNDCHAQLAVSESRKGAILPLLDEMVKRDGIHKATMKRERSTAKRKNVLG